ncbi:MAG: virulence RhuM family protein [Chlorobium phaeobacteroides]|uniref:DNA-binding protein n=1 Tax=Chlorobium phaeobacteroides (strain BS1) TaxID=331678 RepID=B3ENZ5_CHLPB|nr:virulence RhuM family protein [Chlorobium phaeobacteroides]MBL6955891.1 virulence RhuM family protein [Chlorobium phaeobacteroides]
MANEETDRQEGLFLLYVTGEGKVTIEVRLEHDTVWLTQAAMAELFQTTRQNISLHLKNIFQEGELLENSVVKENLTTAADGKSYRQVFMRDWRMKLDAFLQFNEREILGNSGKISKHVADALAMEQYEQFYSHRLQREAEEENLADDRELRAMENKLKKRRKNQ